VDTVFSKAGVNIDLTIVRENIEDTYGGIEHMLTQDVAIARRFITRGGSEQVIRYAFEMAQKKGAKRVTCGHKANIMKLTDGLFLEVFYEIAKEYKDIKADDVIVDDLCMKLVSRPDLFDVIVLTNLQGDIVSDLCAGLVGGLGFAPSSNIGDHISIFEAVHGTAPDIAGKNIANPTSLLLSGLNMLRHLGMMSKAAMIENALLYTLESGIHTGDFGDKSTPSLNTTQFTQAIIDNFGKAPKNNARPIINDVEFVPTNSNISVNPMLFGKQKEEHKIVGADFFVESRLQPNELAQIARKHETAHLNLLIISNRGTQVWPTGSVYTNLVDQFRLRFETSSNNALAQKDIIDLYSSLSKDLQISSVEVLSMWGDKKAYSLAQGQ
jgi:isocitrate dehydrogenase